MNILQRYAHLLVHYCVELRPGERLHVQSTTLAEPLVREVYRAAIKAGGSVEVNLSFREQGAIFLQEAEGEQLDYVSPFRKHAMEEFEAYIYIRAPFNNADGRDADPEKRKRASRANAGVSETYFRRTANRDLKRNLCQYPTQAAAQEAGMSLERYEQFVYSACRLYDDDPIQSWLSVRAEQQRIVDHLNGCSTIRYVNPRSDISYSTQGRTWINSDGQTNMPSGEVYTSPVEDSVNGRIHFDYPAVYNGHLVQGVTFEVVDGYIEHWEADQGHDFLTEILQMEGARRFGEAAIGTNYRITDFTRNILFDEKIGGTVHMAIGQSYLQCGGKNQSPVHWDMIADMTKDGSIYADDQKIYENGAFLI